MIGRLVKLKAFWEMSANWVTQFSHGVICNFQIKINSQMVH